MDQDGDGFLELEELQALLVAMGVEVTYSTLWEFMNKVDQEPPYGKVSWEEFEKYWSVFATGGTINSENLDHWEDRLMELDFSSGGAQASMIRHDLVGTEPIDENGFSKQFQLGKKLGAGKYASVHLCTDTSTREKFALKIFYKKGRSRKNFYSVIDEANKTRTIMGHPNIVQMYHIYETPDRLLIQSEFCAGGQLYDEVLRRKHFSERSAASVSYQLTSACAHMHAHGVAHCDLKPENVLCVNDPTSEEVIVKIADMGLAKVLSDGPVDLSYCGTPLYMSPEMLKKEKYSFATDIWSVGCMTFELLYGDTPFTARNMPELERTVKGFRGMGTDGAAAKRIDRLFQQMGTSKDAVDLISKMLDPSQGSRIAATAALRHVWLSVSSTSPHSRSDLAKSKDKLRVSTMASKKTKEAVVKGNNPDVMLEEREDAQEMWSHLENDIEKVKGQSS